MYADQVSSKTIGEVLDYLKKNNADAIALYDRATENCVLQLYKPNLEMNSFTANLQEKTEAILDGLNLADNPEDIKANLSKINELFLLLEDQKMKDFLVENPFALDPMKLMAVIGRSMQYLPGDLISSVIEKCINELIDLTYYQRQVSEAHP